MSGFSNNFLNSNCLLSLPNEILGIIVDCLIVDSCLPCSESDVIPRNYYSITTKKSFNHVDSKDIISLMKTHHLLHDFVNSRFNFRVCAVFKTLPNTYFLKEDSDVFVFDKNCGCKQFDVVPEFFVSTEFNDLKNTKNIWLSEADPSLPALLGSNWMKGVVETPARNLTSVVFDLKLTTYLFEYGKNKAYSLTPDEADTNYQKSALENIDYDEFPHFLEKTLKSQSFYTVYREYKLQQLFNSLAKLISLQKVLPAVTIIDINGFLLQIVSLLWSFQKYNVSDSLRKLELAAYYFPSPHYLVASYLAGLKKLEKFSLKCYLTRFDENDELPIQKTLSVLHEMTSLKQLNLFTNYIPKTSISFPKDIRRLQITDKALLSISMMPLSIRALNVVEVTLTFLDSFMNSFDGDSTILNFPNLKTFIIKGEFTSNLDFLFLFFKANPTITSVSTHITEEISIIPVLFSIMENVECVDIFLDTEVLESADSALISLIIPQALLFLSSTSVLIFNTLPFKIPLQELVTYLTEPIAVTPDNLTTIIIYSDSTVPMNQDHRDMFFTTVPSDYDSKDFDLDDFTELVPLTTNPPVKEIFSSHKLIIDVIKLRKLHKSRHLPQV